MNFAGTASSGALKLGGVALVAALALAACGPKPTVFAGQNPGVTPQDIRVSKIVVTAPAGMDGRVKNELQDELGKAMPKCATGTRPHTLEVRVESFEDGNSGLAFLVGSAASLDTYSAFVDDTNGKKTSITTFQDKIGGGGLLGAAMMANAPGGLANRLAGNLCKEVFGKELDEYQPEGPGGQAANN